MAGQLCGLSFASIILKNMKNVICLTIWNAVYFQSNAVIKLFPADITGLSVRSRNRSKQHVHDHAFPVPFQSALGMMQMLEDTLIEHAHTKPLLPSQLIRYREVQVPDGR